MGERPDDPRILANSAVLGYGLMLPLVLAALAVWFVDGVLPVLAARLAIIWAALVLTFIGGVRRGFGFALERTSTTSEIVSSTAYFAFAGVALVAPRADLAIGLLAFGFALAAVLDRRAALAGNAPLHFARLRPPQLGIGILALAAIWARFTFGGPA